MMNYRYFFSLIGTVAVFALGIYFARGDFMFFYDPVSLLIIIVPSFLMVLSHHGPVQIIRAFALVRRKNKGTAAEYKNSILLFQSLKQYLMASAFIAVLLGTVLMLSGSLNVRDPALFSRGLGVALLSVIYGAVILLVVVMPCRNTLEMKLNLLPESQGIGAS